MRGSESKQEVVNEQITMHLPELKEVKDNTVKRDFLASIKAYHDILSDTGKTQLVSFIINAKNLRSAKTKPNKPVRGQV
jgi:hypothetical protein